MKKFLTIAAIALVAMSVQAAQINWGLTGQIKFNDTLVGTGANLTLVCLDGIDDWSSYAKDIATGKATEGIAATKVSNTASMAIPTGAGYWTYSWGDSTSVADKTVASGTDFAFVITYEDAGKTYFWASDAFTVQDSGSNWNGTKSTYTMSVAATSVSAWTAVPEPASAMLALAGVAMLIRRRK